MNPVHREMIKDNRDFLTRNISLDKIEFLLKEYKIFNKYMWEDINSVSDVFDALSFRGPHAFENIIEILHKAGYKKEASVLENPILSVDHNLFYKMTSEPLGYCLIINNVKFGKARENKALDEVLKDRDGSDVDAESLQNFFKSIGFSVLSEPNMEGKKMMDYIVKFSERDFTNVDSMILIILSHGGEANGKDFIYGTDGNKVFKEDIYKYFSNARSSLQNKPKMFFFVACRGLSRDYGKKRHNYGEQMDSGVINCTSSSGEIMPYLSDIYIFHSTLPSHVSIRNPQMGTYFVEELVIVLQKYHQRYDLHTMVQLVNNNLKNKISPTYRLVQIGHTEGIGDSKKIMLCRQK